jgi:hypothetical protein
MATNTFVDLPSMKEAKTLADLTSIEQDLRTAREFAELYLCEYGKPQYQHNMPDALMVATLIRYERPFKGGIRTPLPRAEDLLSKEQITKHQYFLAMRDKYIAHPVNDFEENQPIARYWVERVDTEGITADTEGITAIECMHGRIVGLSGEDVRGIIELANAWLEYVQQKLQEEKAKLLEIVRRAATLPRRVPTTLKKPHS